MPPEIIAGRYRIEREVGRGGMGAVWLATDERLGRPVAIKQVGHLPGEWVPDLARAMREARSSAALNHRNVVAVYDAIEEGDHIWLVMEYVPGRTLTEIVAQEGPMSPGAGRLDRRPGRRRARRRPRARDRPPRREARQHPGHRRRRRQDLRLRHRPDPGRGEAHPVRPDDRHPGVLLPGAGPRRGAVARPPTCGRWARRCTPPSRAGRRTPTRPTRSAMLATIASDAPPPAGAGRRPRRADRPDDGPRRLARWGMADCAHALHQIHDAHTSDRTREQTARRRRCARGRSGGRSGCRPLATPSPRR